MISVKIFPRGKQEIGVQVLVYDSKPEMHEGLREWGCPDVHILTEAMCLGMGGADDVCAALFFHADDVGFDVISHECWHATFRWLNTQGIKRVPTEYKSELIPQDAPEERGAHYHGELVQAVLYELFRSKEKGTE